MRVIVCGGRDYQDKAQVWRFLRRFPDGTVIVHGACRTGVDWWAAQAAPDLNLKTEAHPADWRRHGAKAGPLRNQAMADAGADLCLAFTGGKGTADMVRRAEAAGIPVERVL